MFLVTFENDLQQNKDYSSSQEAVKKKTKSQYQINCIVEVEFLFSVCVCRGSGPARSYHSVGIHAESNTLSLIRMCGGVNVGVQRLVKPHLDSSSLFLTLFPPSLSLLYLQFNTLRFIYPLFNQLIQLKQFFEQT